MSYNPHRTVKRNSSKEFLRFAWRVHLPRCNQEPRALDLATVQLDQPVTLVQLYKSLGGAGGLAASLSIWRRRFPPRTPYLNG